MPEESLCVGKRVRDLDGVTEEYGVDIVGLVRRGEHMPGLARRVEIREGDMLVVRATPEEIESIIGVLGLEYARKKSQQNTVLGSNDSTLMQAVVPDGSRIEGRSALSIRLLSRHGVTLLGVSRQGRRFVERVRRLKIRAGDILLLLGDSEQLKETVGWLGCLPLAQGDPPVVQRQKAGLAVGIFGAALALATAGVVYLPVAFGCAVVLMMLVGIVPLRQLYEVIEWPVIVLLGSMIPLGEALETSGGTALITSAIVEAGAGLPPVAVLVIVMVVTMTLSGVMNNVATVVIAAPIGLGIANSFSVNPDSFLMGIAVAASCAFLTPIGHKNNMLILGPGGYRFGDYWRMGLPLEVLVILVGVPMILWIWPL